MLKLKIPKEERSILSKGEKVEKRKAQAESYLSTSTDWKMSVDLKGGLKIPIGVTTTNLKPDIIVVSGKTKQMGTSRSR